MTGQQIFTTPQYSIITINAPKPGLWQIRGLSSDKNSAFILSDITLTSRRFKHHLFAGENTITYAHLTYHGRRISNKIMLNNTRIKLTPGDNKPITLDKPSVIEINYRKEFFIPRSLNSDVLFKFMATSKTFQRARSQLVHLEKFPFKVSFRKKNKYIMKTKVVSNSSMVAKSKIKGEILYKTRNALIDFKQNSPHQYCAKYPIKCIDNSYKVKIQLSGSKINREPFEVQPIIQSFKCRDKDSYSSHIESISDANLAMKPSYTKKNKLSKKVQSSNWRFILLIIETFLFLGLISLLIRMISLRKKRQELTNIIDKFIPIAEEEEEVEEAQQDADDGDTDPEPEPENNKEEKKDE